MTTLIKNTYGYIGCEYYCTPSDRPLAGSHLTTSQAYGVTANSYDDTYLDGNQVIVIAKLESGDIAGYLAVATGEMSPNPASFYWPSWDRSNARVNVLMPVTKIHLIPSEFLGKLTQRGIDGDRRQGVATYLLRKG